MTGRLPRTVEAAVVLAGLNAVIVTIALFPSGLLWGFAYAAGAFGLLRLRKWGYWLLLTTAVAAWLQSALNGRVEFISFGIVIAALLLMPSTRGVVFTSPEATSDGPPID